MASSSFNDVPVDAIKDVLGRLDGALRALPGNHSDIRIIGPVVMAEAVQMALRWGQIDADTFASVAGGLFDDAQARADPELPSVPQWPMNVPVPVDSVRKIEAAIRTAVHGDDHVNVVIFAMLIFGADLAVSYGMDREVFVAYTKAAFEVYSGSSPAPEPKTGRNEMCPCGGGKKFKKCHGKYMN